MKRKRLTFEWVDVPPRRLLVASAHRDSVAGALLEGQGCVPMEPTATGRGTLFRFALGDGDGVVKPCRRGGAIRYFVKDAYLLRNRPLQEFSVHVTAYERDLPVPEPLGVLWERRGPCFRGALATRFVPMPPLAQFLLESPPEAADRALLHAGRLVRMMHDHGLFHGDLNAGNILANEDEACLLDLDKARFYSRLSEARRMANLARLDRSMTKLGLRSEWCTRLVDVYHDVQPRQAEHEAAEA